MLNRRSDKKYDHNRWKQLYLLKWGSDFLWLSLEAPDDVDNKARPNAQGYVFGGDRFHLF